VTEPPEPVGPDDDVPALRSELDQLRLRNQELEHARAASATIRLARISQAAVSAILIVFGVLCLTVAPVAIWGRNLVLDTDRYVETLTPVAGDPGVQQAVITAVDQQVENNLDVTALIGQVLPDRAAALLGAPLQSAVESLVTSVTTKFVQSDAFQTVWVTVNRTAHQQVVYLLTGKRPANAAIKLNDNGKLILDLAPIVDQVKQRLVAAGLTVAKNVPAVGATIELADAQGLVKARKGTRLLDTVADWLPWAGIASAGIGIAVARRRRRALISAALGLAVGMIVVGVAVIFGRGYYLDHVPPQLPQDTASYLFDTLVRFLRLGLRLVLLMTLLVAFGAWISGSSRPARSVRHAVATGPRALGRRLNSGPVGPFVDRYATALRIAAVAAMVIVLLLIDDPTLGTVILLAVLAVVLLLLIELLRATSSRSRSRPA
jgi:hypothetical protein